MTREKQDLFGLFSQLIHPSSEAFPQQYLPLLRGVGNRLYLPFVDSLVDWQIPVGCLYEQMAMRNT